MSYPQTTGAPTCSVHGCALDTHEQRGITWWTCPVCSLSATAAPIGTQIDPEPPNVRVTTGVSDESSRFRAEINDLTREIERVCVERDEAQAALLAARRREEELRDAAYAVLEDHANRVDCYGEQEKQPARLKVMGELRAALAAAEESHEEIGGGPLPGAC